ncbi:enoyl-CoA hydratase/isomerase family protein [Yinghuangia seranimata]|uniref:enoyl-CoA hydratase/isomerase family protein n=1 Tax=Yinghuangia seranimata TaxID=408067 RepID=UPI00248AE82E|nr:enoyl-CoA hydratase-related protein [Yinghuangia seranimata]MDI2128278.1 enoyl-CoA hydratase-related protein [Yinghuangia seranimata]
MADGDHYGFTYLRTELRGRILWVTLDRPERRNAISPEMHAEFTPLFRRVAADEQVDVVVVTGAGDKAFCVGADFAGMDAKLTEGYPDGNPELLEGSAALVRAQLAVPQPVIAAVNGDALGLGATLALFCDVTFLADTARIGDPHVNAGLVAGDGGAILWPLLLGVNRGKEYLMTGDMMTADEALRYGLVNHVCPAAEVRTRAAALAERLAAGPQIAIRFNKRLANTELADRVNRLLDTSLALEAVTFETADHREAVTAFLERRHPHFGGNA